MHGSDDTFLADVVESDDSSVEFVVEWQVVVSTRELKLDRLPPGVPQGVTTDLKNFSMTEIVKMA